jgi:MFS family permease
MVQEVVPAEIGRAPSQEGVWSRANRGLTVGLVLTVAGAAFETLAVATILPALARELNGVALYGWAFSAFMLTNLIGVTLAGAEADRHGPARPYAAGIALFALGLLIAGLAPSMAVVIAGRAVQGLGAGVISAVAYVAIGRGYSEAAKPRMLAVTSSAWVIPGLIGPAVGGVIADHAGWRWVFLGLVPLMLAAAALSLPPLRRLSLAARGPRDWSPLLTSARLAAGAGLLLAGIGAIGAAATGGGAAAPVAPYALAAAMLAAGTALGLPALRRLMPAGTLRAAPGLPATIAASGLLNLAFFGVDAFVPLALTAGRGQSATAAGIPLTVATLAWSSGAWVQAHLAARGLRRGLVIAGLALIAAGIVGVTAVLAPAVPIAVASVAWGLGGLGMGFAYSTISLVVLETAAPGQEGAASAAMQLANGLATAIGAGVGGAIIGAASDSGRTSLAGIAGQNALMTVITLLAVVVAARVSSRHARSR